MEQLTSVSSRSLGGGDISSENLSARKGVLERFLRAATSVDAPIDLSMAELIAVWPLRKSSPVQYPEHRSVQDMRNLKIHLVGFVKTDEYEFSRE